MLACEVRRRAQCLALVRLELAGSDLRLLRAERCVDVRSASLSRGSVVGRFALRCGMQHAVSWRDDARQQRAMI